MRPPLERLTARPFPASRFVPGRGPHPGRSPRDGAAHGVATDDDFRYGIDLYDAGFWWEAHEAWEAHWHDRRDPHRRALAKALILLAAACLKREVGLHLASRRLARRSLDLLRNAAERAPHYLELDLCATAAQLEALLQSDHQVLAPLDLARVDRAAR